MEPSLNSTRSTKPPTRALICTCWIASNRPTNSSQSVTVRAVGGETVTAGGGGAVGCSAAWLQAAAESASASNAARCVDLKMSPGFCTFIFLDIEKSIVLLKRQCVRL